MKITAEIVNGKCPTCEEFTMLVGLTATVYRCMNCGTDLEQHVNGKIRYLPHITRSGDAEPYVREWKDGEKIQSIRRKRQAQKKRRTSTQEK